MKGYKYLVLIVAAVIILIISVTWDTEKGNESNAGKNEDKKRLVLLSHVYNNDYWAIIRNGAEKAAEERGAILEYAGPETSSLEESLRLIEKYTIAKKDGIITYVLDADKTQGAIDKAVDKGIPIITIDTDAPESKRLAYVGTDNIKAGEKAARELMIRLRSKDEIGIIMGGRSNTNQIERVEGFKNYIEKNSDIEIVDILSSDSYALEAELAAKKLLKDAQYIDAIYCTSALDGMGAARAVEDIKMGGKIKIISFDDLPETIEYIERGIISATIAQKPYDMGYKAVSLMMDVLEGESLSYEEYITETTIITKSSLLEQKKNNKGE